MSIRKLKLLIISTLLTVLLVGCASVPQDIGQEVPMEKSSEPREGPHGTDIMHKSKEGSDDMERLD